MQNVLVLGGNGFIGRHAVMALMAQSSVTVGTRSAKSREDGLTEISVRLESLLQPEDWHEIVAPFDSVLNCVGILRQRGRETYDRIHHLAPAAIAEACRSANKRFIHVSALALEHPHRSRFLTSKLAGEKAIASIGGDWALARPSLLEGKGGFGAAWLRGVARLPIFAVPADARGKIAACLATDVGEALAKLCTADDVSLRFSKSRVFELGGIQHYGFKEYILGLRQKQHRGAALAIPVPGLLARIGAHLCDLFHFSPFSFGHWELLRKDNVPTENRLPELLGRTPGNVI
ncbi:MAG: NAD(P)H-binding protein [Pseudomonadota bacterium]